MKQLILNDFMVQVKTEIKNTGFYRVTALNSDKERRDVKRMIKIGMIKPTGPVNGTYIDFIKNYI